MQAKLEALRGTLTEWLSTVFIVGVFTTGILWISGAPPWDAYRNILAGSIGSWIKIEQVLTVWVPLTLCACGLQYTFQVGLWNIGIEGQVTMGAVGAVAILRMGMDNPETGAWLVFPAIVWSLLAGGSWALLASLLKTRGGVNEIFGGLGLNFVAQGFSLWLIFGPWKRPGIASMSGTEPLPPALWLPGLEGWRVSPYALVTVVVILVCTAWVLKGSRIGLSFKAIGANLRASPLYGLNPGREMLLAMFLGGGLAGLAGAFQVTQVYHRLIPSISSQYGYLGLLVVMLAGYRLRWVPFIAFFFAALNVGSIQLPMVLQLDSSLSGIIQGALVLATLMFQGWRKLRAEAQAG